jgi:hypothetical protein
VKKSLIALVLVFSMLVAFVGTVSAAPLASGTATLVSVDYIPGKGPVFTFLVSGKFSNSELKGSLHIENGEDFDLHCSQVDSTTVKCTVSKKAAGKHVALSWGGSTFWTSVPAAPEHCYSVWDWWDFTNYQWTDFGPHCQEQAAKAGDETTYTVPDPTGSFDGWAVFIDQDVSGKCGGTVPYTGPAYYYPGCPFLP